jgi:hypothetical protein
VASDIGPLRARLYCFSFGPEVALVSLMPLHDAPVGIDEVHIYANDK